VSRWNKKGILFNDHWSQLPIVDNSSEDIWRVYYSKRINNKSYPNYFDVKVGKNLSVINNSMEPILKLGKLGTFDHAGVMPAEIVDFENKKYLYYIGWSNRIDVPYFNNIGLAISEDNGETYKKFSTGPVLGCSYKEPGYTGTISILIENNIWRGWYLSCRKWEKIENRIEPIYDIKYAESTNGIDWNPKNITCINLKADEGGISQASVIKEDNKYKMWFSYRSKSGYRKNKNKSYRIGYAESHDGLVWTRYDNQGLDISKDGWDSEMVEYPYVFNNGDKKYMLYNGNGFGKTGIGIAELDIAL
jgi:hypothetical protein